MASPKLDELCINTIRFLSVDTVQKANSGHLTAAEGPHAHYLVHLSVQHLVL